MSQVDIPSPTVEPATTLLMDGSPQNSAGAASALESVETTLVPVSFTLSPAATIWGLSVEEFSYIFLIIGGVAPVVFIIITIIAMKCYSVRRRRTMDKYASQYRTAQELWEMERQEYLSSAGTPAVNAGRSPNRLPPPKAGTHTNGESLNGGTGKNSNKVSASQNMIHTQVLDPQTIVDVERPAHSSAVYASSSNPNVYFKGSSGESGDAPNRGRGDANSNSQRMGRGRASTSRDNSGSLVLAVTAFNNRSPDSSPNLTQITDISQNDIQEFPGLPSPQSEAPSAQVLGSEEAKALAAFDRIYENLDVSLTTTSSSEYNLRAASYIDTGSVVNPLPTLSSDRHVSSIIIEPRETIHTMDYNNSSLPMGNDNSRLNPAFSNTSISDANANMPPQPPTQVTVHYGSSTNHSTFINSAFVPDIQHES